MRIMVTPRDGIGPEIAAATMDVVEAANRTFDPGLRFDYEDTGFISLGKYGTTLRDETIERARTYDGIILGPQSLMDYPPHDKGGVNVSAGFRVKLDLHANVRPARVRPFLNSASKPMDLAIMREATEGFYPDRNMHAGSGELMPTPDVALSVRKITAHACERIARGLRAGDASRQAHSHAGHALLWPKSQNDDVVRRHGTPPEIAPGGAKNGRDQGVEK